MDAACSSKSCIVEEGGEEVIQGDAGGDDDVRRTCQSVTHAINLRTAVDIGLKVTHKGKQDNYSNGELCFLGEGSKTDTLASDSYCTYYRSYNDEWLFYTQTANTTKDMPRAFPNCSVLNFSFQKMSGHSTHHVLLLVGLDGAVLAVGLLLGGRVQLRGGERDDGVGVVVRLHGDPRRVDSLGPSTWNNVHIVLHFY